MVTVESNARLITMGREVTTGPGRGSRAVTVTSLPVAARPACTFKASR